MVHMVLVVTQWVTSEGGFTLIDELIATGSEFILQGSKVSLC